MTHSVSLSLVIDRILSISVLWTVLNLHTNIIIHPYSFDHFTAQTPSFLAVWLGVIVTDILPISALLWTVGNPIVIRITVVKIGLCEVHQTHTLEASPDVPFISLIYTANKIAKQEIMSKYSGNK